MPVLDPGSRTLTKPQTICLEYYPEKIYLETDGCGLAKSLCVWAALCLQYYRDAYTTLFVDTIRKIVRRVSVGQAAAAAAGS
jgi:hypothetical protein